MRHNSTVGNKILFLPLALGLLITAPVWAKGAKDADSPAAKAGQKLFDQNCSVCHYDNQTGTKVGPSLKGLFKAKELPASHKPVTDANVRAQIEKGNPDAKPMPMPAFGSALSKTDIDNLIAYLKTL